MKAKLTHLALAWRYKVSPEVSPNECFTAEQFLSFCDLDLMVLRSFLNVPWSRASRAVSLRSLVYTELLKKTCKLVFEVHTCSHFWPTVAFTGGHTTEDLLPFFAPLTDTQERRDAATLKLCKVTHLTWAFAMKAAHEHLYFIGNRYDTHRSQQRMNWTCASFPSWPMQSHNKMAKEHIL